MSIETWKSEFYATDAEDTSAHEATKHSITKWSGLGKEDLDRHGVFKDGQGSMIRDNEGGALSIYGGTCALCVHFEGGGDCLRCPLYQARGGVRCDMQTLSETVSPYFAFVRNGDPRPMLRWLKKTKRFEESRDKAAAKKAAAKKAAARKRAAK